MLPRFSLPNSWGEHGRKRQRHSNFLLLGFIHSMLIYTTSLLPLFFALSIVKTSWQSTGFNYVGLPASFYNVPWCQLRGWTKKKLGSTFFATIHVLHTVFVGQQMPQLKKEHLRLVEFFLHYNCIYCSWPSVVKACFKAGGRQGGQLPPLSF